MPATVKRKTVPKTSVSDTNCINESEETAVITHIIKFRSNTMAPNGHGSKWRCLGILMFPWDIP